MTFQWFCIYSRRETKLGNRVSQRNENLASECKVSLRNNTFASELFLVFQSNAKLLWANTVFLRNEIFLWANTTFLRGTQTCEWAQSFSEKQHFFYKILLGETQNKCFLEERNIFESKCKIYQRNKIPLRANAVSWRNAFWRNTKLLRVSRTFLRETIFLQENTTFLRQSTSDQAQHFSEKQSFCERTRFSKESNTFASERKISQRNTIVLRAN